MSQRTSADSGPLFLFVCTGNFYRSRHAEALFNWHARRTGHPARAFSRGLLTSLVADEPTLISRDTEKRLGELGIPLELTGAAPTQLRREDLERAHRTIALKRDEHYAMMLQSHPEWADRIDYWTVHDIDFAQPTEALPQIEGRILELMKELTGQAGA
ncbi:MAG: low molecular weight phosphatase family protein [Verrucomicrobiota bacterium]|jgi:protein-tyrosine phosphatase